MDGVKQERSCIAEFVIKQRKEFNITQKELSKKAGVGLRFIRELEQDKPTLMLHKVNQVLALFGARVTPRPIGCKPEI